MIRDFWVENYYSIKERQEMDFEVRSKEDEWMRVEPTPGVYLSKLGIIYGANASGKSNLVKAIGFVKNTLMEGLPVNCANDFCRSDLNNQNRESIFELQFTVDDKFYAYGFSTILNQKIITE